ncbi:MAG TPA: OB-fold nucleic acid binding domain-containing protein [Holophagaceae bacterium]|nr:OB-fold nucleic acid binding domain-containing protein [Holophagaceae bacterium]
MTFALGISDFSVGEGVYPAAQLLKLARRLGYGRLVLWDRGLHGWPKLRHELDWALELEGMGMVHPSFDGPGPPASAFRIHLGCRFAWRGREYGALPEGAAGYAALNKLLTDQAHGREGGLPEGCRLLAEDLAGLDALLRAGVFASLLAHPRRAGEARAALAAGLPVLAPQVLRFRTLEGLELHRLKRAIATQGTLPRTEPLWDARDAVVPRGEWEARFPACEPAVARATAEAAERLDGWALPWGAWTCGSPKGLEGADLDAVLRERCLAALPRRMKDRAAEAEARLERELELIRYKKFAGYFLLVQDLVLALRPAGLPSSICGRGSGAASLVSYLLGLSNVDPVATNLLFERFLTRERKDPPDMDIDFAWDERDRVIQAAFERYGRDRVAMVSNHVFFKPRSALRAVALAHGRPEAELKTLSERVRGWDGGFEGLPESDPWRPILAQALAIQRHFHQMSVHPGGLVLTGGPLWEHAAFQPAPAKEGVSVTAWDKDGVEGYGLVKIDLLGNRSLAVIRDAWAALGRERPEDIGAVSRGDAETQALLARGDSMGVFYVESPAMRQLQQRVERGDFETLVIHSSLIRPAAWHWVDHYVKRARGEEAYTPSDPVFADLLSESYGVLVYQEDVIKVCVALAGWSHHRADQLRKLLGKPECLEKLPLFEREFRDGCAARGVRAEVVEEAWDMIRTFRGYSFCKPHSASYAQVSFESAWLKAHHPAVFFAAVISNQGGFYPAVAYLGDARRHRLVVRGPDVNASRWPFTAEGERGLRVGLMQVKGALAAEVEALLAERDARGPFAGMADLLARAQLSLTTVEALASAGAFDRFAPDGDRTALLWERLGGVPPGLRPRPTDPFDRADLELETLSLTLEIHPAALARVRRSGGPDRAEAAAKADRDLRFWALVVAEKVVQTERGERMQFVTLEDETGLVECVAFPPAFARRRRPYQVGEVVLARGRTAKQDRLIVLELA